jgi:hypothetical protein
MPLQDGVLDTTTGTGGHWTAASELSPFSSASSFANASVSSWIAL